MVRHIDMPDEHDKTREQLIRALAQAKARIAEMTSEIAEIKSRNGEEKSTPIYHTDGSISKQATILGITESKRMEEALRASETEMRALFAAMTDLVFVFNSEGRYLKIVDTRPSLLYKPFNELLGKTLHDVFPKERADFFLNHLKQALRTQQPVHFEYSLTIEDKEFWFNATISSMSGETTLMVARDITERKKAEEALHDSVKRFRELADSMPQLVWTAEPDGHVDYYNVKHKQFRGIQRSVDGTYQWSPVLHEEDEAPTVEAWERAYRTGKTYQIEHRVQLKDGSYRWYLSRGIPVRDDAGRIVKWFGTATDIENVKKAELQLRQLNEILEEKVAERTELAEARSRQLQALAIELIEAEERERRQFAYLLHDDLQQILAAARMQVQEVAERLHTEPLLSSAADLLETSIKKARRLSHELSPTVLYQSGLVPALNWLAGHMKEQFGLEVEFGADMHEPLDSNPVKVFLFRAARELLFNITKHAGVPKAWVTVSASNRTVALTVKDAGRGFSPTAIENSAARAGFGLLSIRERATYIGGSLAIESAPGKGSCLTLTVPFKVPDAIPETTHERPAKPYDAGPGVPLTTATAGETRVMFVDDHKVMRQGLIRLVKNQPSIKVVGEAANGLEALELANQLRPNVIVMDVSMPIMDGIEATRRIKAEIPEIHVIGLSMHEDEQVKRDIRDAGADAFVCKTVSAAELIKVIYSVAG
jgi:PAS domain S-box-containing protein